jgi:flagellar basal body-associated protein FliL
MEKSKVKIIVAVVVVIAVAAVAYLKLAGDKGEVVDPNAPAPVVAEEVVEETPKVVE